MTDIGIIGGGINGLCAAWEMAKQGHQVTLYERGNIMEQTSRSSSKMLHGGLRYLENYEFRLVKESLYERRWWIDQAPHLVKPLEIFIPIYRHSRRPRWVMQLGLMLYDFLAGKIRLGPYRRYTQMQFSELNPQIDATDLKGGFSYVDAQMDDYALGRWVADQAESASAKIISKCEVSQVSRQGDVSFTGRASAKHELLFNIAGPWAEQLLRHSNLEPTHSLDAVRGSHIVFNDKIENGYFLEVPNERRIFFVLPYKGQTMVGTTERHQTLDQPIKASDEEIDYLLAAYNHHFKHDKTRDDIVHQFAGVRPLIRSSADPNKISREYEIDQQEKLVTVYGGKWTTSHALAVRLCGLV